MRREAILLTLTASLTALPAAAEGPVSLRGSPQSMVRQNQVAKTHELPFAATEKELREMESAGELVRLGGNDDYDVADFVSFPVARPEMRTFIERLAAQYREATGEKLVVTSLTRPASRQPGNSHALSIHPTGIAVDLRISQRSASRAWLENTLLGLERQGVLDVTREQNPPHYHVALFPGPYMAHVERLEAANLARSEAPEAEAPLAAMPEVAASLVPAPDPAPEAGSRARRLAIAAGLVLGGLLFQRRDRLSPLTRRR